MMIRAPALRRLETTSEVIEALGGPSTAGEILRLTPQGVSNAKARNSFSHRRFLVVVRELRKRGYYARPTLWGIDDLEGLLVSVE